MSEPTSSSESTIASPWKAWDWRLLDFLTRWLPNQPEPPPRASMYFGLILGMLEAAIVSAYGGIACVILAPTIWSALAGHVSCMIISLFWGALVGAICGMFGGRVLHYVRSLALSLLISSAIGAVGAGLIALHTFMFARLITSGAFWEFAGLVLFFGPVISIPLVALLPTLVYREIRAALAGMVIGSLLGLVCPTVVVLFLVSDHFEVWWVPPLCVLAGVIWGLIDGGLAGTVVGALIGALLNVNRRTVLPTYSGFVGAIGFGVAGWIIGGKSADFGGEALGAMLGIFWGAMVGIRIGALLTLPCWKALSLVDKMDSSSLPLFDMSDGRRLADFADTTAKGLLVIHLFAQICFRKRELRLEPAGDEYRVTFDSSGLDLELPPTMLLCTGHELIIALKKLARLGSGDRDDSLCQEGDLQVIISKYRVNLHLVFEQTPQGERVTLTAPVDVGASDAMAAVGRRLLFIMAARRWFFPRGRLTPRFLQGIA